MHGQLDARAANSQRRGAEWPKPVDDDWWSVENDPWSADNDPGSMDPGPVGNDPGVSR